MEATVEGDEARGARGYAQATEGAGNVPFRRPFRTEARKRIVAGRATGPVGWVTQRRQTATAVAPVSWEEGSQAAIPFKLVLTVLRAEDVDLKRDAKATDIGNTEDIRDPVRAITLDDNTHRGVVILKAVGVDLHHSP